MGMISLRSQGCQSPRCGNITVGDANDDGEAKCSDNNHWVYHFSDPESSEVTIKVRRLDAKGRQQAQQLAQVLPLWLADNNYQPIRRVETKDPRTPHGEQRTQNPFQTVYPLVKSLERDRPDFTDTYVRFKFLDSMQEDELTYETLKDHRGSFSTLVCWDNQGLWGEKNSDKQWPSSTSVDSIFNRLIPGKVTAVPGKGEDIYILTFDHGNNKFVLGHHLKLSELVQQYSR